jgi:hypothetical protein
MPAGKIALTTTTTRRITGSSRQTPPLIHKSASLPLSIKDRSVENRFISLFPQHSPNHEKEPPCGEKPESGNLAASGLMQAVLFQG